MWQDIDAALSVALNAFVGAYPAFDQAVHHLTHNTLLKSLPLLTAFWFLWFKEDEQRSRRRATLLMGLLGCVVALGAVRGLTQLLPFRVRPIAEPSLGLHAVAGMPSADWFERMNAMPSDHAGLFFALAVALWAGSRRVGVWALLHASVLIALPRIYLGLHYPGDILVGALVGASIVWLLTRARMVDTVGVPVLARLNAAPAWAYAALFVATFQMASMFESVRSTLRFAGLMLR